MNMSSGRTGGHLCRLLLAWDGKVSFAPRTCYSVRVRPGSELYLRDLHYPYRQKQHPLVARWAKGSEHLPPALKKTPSDLLRE